MYIYIYLGNHPQMAGRFRLVNYSNLPRYTFLKTLVILVTLRCHQTWLAGKSPFTHRGGFDLAGDLTWPNYSAW